MDRTTYRRRITRPRASAEPGGEPIILAIMAGQSNMNGRNPDDGLTASISDGYEYVSDPAHANFQTIQPISGPLNHGEGMLRTGPDEQIVADLKAANPDAKIVAVPCAHGSTAIIGGGWQSSATEGAGGGHYEEMIDRVNEAHAAALAEWPGAAIEVQIYFVQGEQDAANGQTKAAYLAALSDWITHARSRITGAANAPFIMGSLLPQKWIESSPHYNAAYAAINEAHVALSLNDPNAFYARGPDDRAANDNLHYQPASVARAFGTRMATWNSDSVGPNVTSGAAQGSEAGSPLSVVLTHDDPLGHATFAITGGADAALFEISDPYINPVLRWVGDGTGPAARDYAVEVSARDGFGNVGPARAFTVNVAQPYGTGDQGPVTVSQTYAEEEFTPAYGGFTRTVPLKKGLNLFFFLATNNSNDDASFAVTVDGNLATKLVGGTSGSNVQVWSTISTIEVEAEVAVSYAGGSVNYVMQVAALTGSKAAPLSAAVQPMSNDNGSTPYTANSLTVPTEALLVCFAVTNQPTLTAVAPSVLVARSGATVSVALLTRDTSGAVQFNGGSYSGSASLVFERSE